jgi:cytoskeleton protein RodZ
MSSLGVYLRGLREAKGVSIDDISRSTRVGRRHLEALEADSPADLPAPVFVKGFIRAYCEFLEAPTDEAFDLFRQAPAEPPRAARTLAPLRSRPRRSGPLLVSAILFLALGGSLLALHFGLRGSSHDKPAPPSPTSRASEPAVSRAPVPVAVMSAPIAPATSNAPAAAVSPPGEPKTATQRLVVRAVEPTWLRVQVDDGQTAEELLQAGAVREWTAARRFVLTIGNAGGLEVDLNGRRIPPLGARGVVIQKLVLPQDAAPGGS